MCARIAYSVPLSVAQAFADVYFEGVDNEKYEAFASHWGGLDLDAFQRAFARAQGEEKLLAIFVLGRSTLPGIADRLLTIVAAPAPRMERWAGALSLGRMKEVRAFPLIASLLPDGLSLAEYTAAAQQPADELAYELWWCGLKRSELITLLEVWKSPIFVQILRQLVQSAWTIEKTLYPAPIANGVVDYDTLAYVMGMHGVFGGFTGIDLPMAYWKTALVYIALGSLHAQASERNNLIDELDRNVATQREVAAILAQRFGLTTEEQEDCIQNFSAYSNARQVGPPFEESIDEIVAADFFEDEEDEEENTNIQVKIPILMCLYSGHTARIHSFSWSADGTRIVSASEDTTVQVWDAITGQMLVTFYKHQQSVNTVAWSPSDSLIASGGNDNKIFIWDAKTGEQVCVCIGHTAWICDLAWSPDGTRVVSASLDKTVRVWNATSGEVLHVLHGHESIITSVAWSIDGTRLASGGGYPECLIYLWNATTGAQQMVYRKHTADIEKERLLPHNADEWAQEELRKASSVHYLVWSPDGRSIASAGLHNICRVWDTITGNDIMATYRTGGPVEWSHDGNSLYWLSDGWRNVDIWNIVHNNLQATYQLDTHDFITRFQVSPDGEYLVADDDKQLRVWQL